MNRVRKKTLCGLLALVVFSACGPSRICGQSSDPVAKALADGELYESKHNWELALDAYLKADKLSHHTSAEAMIRIAVIEKRAGSLSDAANEAKKAVAAAGDNKTLALKARLLRATLLTQMANKPTDNKLKDAEAELRMALALEPQQPVTHLNLGTVLLKEDKDAEGIAELKSYLELPNTDPASVAAAKRFIANPIRARTPFVPQFSLTTYERQNVSSASLRGKVALIDFWGTWCPPCRESVPILKKIQKRYSTKAFQLLSISSDDDEDVWKTFIESQHMDWLEYLDSSGELQEKFEIDSFPTYLVVDRDGVVRFRQSGLSQDTQGDLEDAIDRALKKESNPELAKASAEEDQATGEPESKASAPGAAAAPGMANSEPASKAAAASHISSDSSSSGAAPANLYTNTELGLRYKFPEGWKAASEDTLRLANERMPEGLRNALLKQQSQAPENIRILAPKFIFYASRRGDGSPERPSLSSISLRIVPTHQDTVDEAQFRMRMDSMAAVTQLKPLAPAGTFEVKNHRFVQADFERSSGALHYFQSYVQTVAGEYLLDIQVLAESPEQLHQITDTLQTMQIEGPE